MTTWWPRLLLIPQLHVFGLTPGWMCLISGSRGKIYVVDAIVHHPDHPLWPKHSFQEWCLLSQPALTLEIVTPPYYVCPQGKQADNITHRGVRRCNERWYKGFKEGQLPAHLSLWAPLQLHHRWTPPSAQSQSHSQWSIPEYCLITLLYLNSYSRIYFLGIQPHIIKDNNNIVRKYLGLIMYQTLFKMIHTN